MKKIMIATDGSDPSAEALEVAIELARETNATLEVLSVRPPRPVGRGGAGPAILEVEQAHGAEQIADAAAQQARDAGIEATAHAAHGDVVDCIADAATSLKVDMLVVGSRGMGSLSGAVMGSVSHALVHRSPVPVTIVRHAAARVATGS